LKGEIFVHPSVQNLPSRWPQPALAILLGRRFCPRAWQTLFPFVADKC